MTFTWEIWVFGMLFAFLNFAMVFIGTAILKRLDGAEDRFDKANETVVRVLEVQAKHTMWMENHERLEIDERVRFERQLQAVIEGMEGHNKEVMGKFNELVKSKEDEHRDLRELILKRKR